MIAFVSPIHRQRALLTLGVASKLDRTACVEAATRCVLQAAFRLIVGNGLRAVCRSDPIPSLPPAGIRCAWRSIARSARNNSSSLCVRQRAGERFCMTLAKTLVLAA